jgi:hypothetical protein
MNITIDIMLQMPPEYVSLLLDFDIMSYENLSAYKTLIRIFSARMITDNTINLTVSIPNYDVNTFRQRFFEFYSLVLVVRYKIRRNIIRTIDISSSKL